jgi:hypothetical protein
LGLKAMAPTQKAINIFRCMRQLEPDTSEWQQLDWKLHRELQLRPWEGCPTVVLPGAKPVFPEGCAGGEWERRTGPQLFAALCKAAEEFG